MFPVISCFFRNTHFPLLLPSGVTIKPGRPSLLIANGQSCAESTKLEPTHNDCATIQVESSCLQIKSNATRGKIKSQRQETQTKRQKRGLQPPLLGKVARQKKLKVVKQTIVILIIARVQIAASSLVDFSPGPAKLFGTSKFNSRVFYIQETIRNTSLSKKPARKSIFPKFGIPEVY